MLFIVKIGDAHRSLDVGHSRSVLSRLILRRENAASDLYFGLSEPAVLTHASTTNPLRP